jgi:tetratricopeptide (TPR) repeat protein
MLKQPKKFTLADVLWERDIWRHYYDGMDAVREKRLKDAEARFREIIQLNPNFPGSYEGLAAIAMAERNRPMTRKLTEIAYEKVQAAYPRWPRRLSWAEIENRPILRIIQMRALLDHGDGNLEEAEQLYRLLLKLNPSDNQGIRYLLKDLKAGLSPDKIAKNA